MLCHNKGVNRKGKLSADESSLKSQFWTGEWILLKSKNYHKFSFSLLRVQNVPPSCLLWWHTMALDMSGHWTIFQSKGAAVNAPFHVEQVRAQPSLVCSCSLEGSWAPLAMKVLLMGWNLCGWESMLLCWIPPFSIWTWNLFAILQGCFVAFLFQWCKSCLLLPSP